ncbi:hypothetical protein CALVIDRAFT_543156 [Calocera viscosa TUFC12733]|uniref:Uncharacterized protein n=1 Tax=Calocera viscosa (strain TUFC12733) TaxID=1330018 RepID=A0A167FWS0_CALVF|nr:hypothetical protein CALVIDRAFT_543156 [Calocera viscosa TUFC12733]
MPWYQRRDSTHPPLWVIELDAVVSCATAIILTDAVMALRTWAIWGRTRLSAVLLIVAWIAVTALSLYYQVVSQSFESRLWCSPGFGVDRMHVRDGWRHGDPHQPVCDIRSVRNMFVGLNSSHNASFIENMSSHLCCDTCARLGTSCVHNSSMQAGGADVWL